MRLGDADDNTRTAVAVMTGWVTEGPASAAEEAGRTLAEPDGASTSSRD